MAAGARGCAGRPGRRVEPGPRTDTRERTRLHASRWLLAGAGTLLLAFACSVLSLTSGPPWLGFGSAFCVLLGFAFTVPTLIAGASAVIRRTMNVVESGHDVGTRSPADGSAFASVYTLLRLASQNLHRSLHRTAVIVAALMAAVAMTVGISVMIHAFRQTVETWIDRAIVADIFMTPAANETLGNGAFFPPDVLAALRREPAVRTVDTVREIGINVRGDRVSMAVVEGDNQNRLAFVGGHAAEKAGGLLPARHGARQRAVRAPLPRRRGRPAADHHARRQAVEFAVAGVYYDYSRDAGIVAISRQNFLRHWHDDRVMSAAIYLKTRRPRRHRRPDPAEVQPPGRVPDLFEPGDPRKGLRDFRADLPHHQRPARDRGRGGRDRNFSHAHHADHGTREGDRRPARARERRGGRCRASCSWKAR